MAYPILGTPKPAFFDSSGSPLAGGTLTIQDPDTSSAKAWYATATDADSQSGSSTSDVTLDARGEPTTQLWGRDGEDYKVILKDSEGSTIYTLDEIRLPLGLTNVSKVKTADESLTTTTLANDTHLINWSLEANTYYKLTGFLVATATGATQDLRLDFVVDNALQDSNYSYLALDAATGTTVDAGDVQIITDPTTIDIDGASDVGITLNGFLFTNASFATNLDLQVAQGTDSGTTTLKKGSWIKIEPLVT